MSVSMKPVVLSLLRSRVPLPLFPLGASLLVRANHDGRVDWHGSDLQGVLAMIIYLAVVPMLSITLATGWLRGEAGPWSWALARPITRWRWLGTTLLVDALTLAACVLAGYVVIGALPSSWIGPWSSHGPREVGYLALLATIHCGAAFGGARGASAIGAAIYASAFVGATLLAKAIATVTSEILGTFTYRHDFEWRHIWRDLTPIGTPRLLGRGELEEVIALALVMAVATASIIVVLRAGRSLPARPRPPRVVVALVLVAIVTGILAPLAATSMLPASW